MKKLKVLIPTYNRKEYLKNLLENLSSQGHYDEYNIVISDNHSDYDLMGMINESFSKDFIEIISYHKWNYNVGMMTNISLPFSFVETEWCLFLSDDDKIRPNTLEVVLRDLNEEGSKELAAIKYSLAKYRNSSFIHKDCILRTTKEWAEYYLKFQPGSDDRIYMSMLYNMRLLNPYLMSLTRYSYSGAPFLIPIINALAEGKGYLRLSSEGLYEYNINTTDSWYSNSKRFLDTLLGIRTMFDSFHGMDFKSYKLFKKMILSENFRCKTIVHAIANQNGFIIRRHYYKLLRDYMVGNLWQQIMYRSIFWIILLLNISPSKLKMIVKRIRGVK